jgi:hypothetical protein
VPVSVGEGCEYQSAPHSAALSPVGVVKQLGFASD